MNYLGRVLFPKQPAWQAKRQARQIVAAFVVAVVFGLAIAAIIWFTNARR
jgi:hypothetical protein